MALRRAAAGGNLTPGRSDVTAPADPFAPALYADVRRPLLEAGLLPPWCYTSREFYEREVRRIYMRAWNLVGRVERIPEPGDYFTIELAGVPVIVLRGEDCRVRAFANTCRHRGCRLLTGEGRCERYITCPYHGWAYGFDGGLVGAPGMRETHRFDRSEHALHAVRLEAWEGFMFVCFDARTESLMDYLGDFPERFAGYRFGDMVMTRRKESVAACNWKLLVENAMEGYHTASVHGGSLGRQELVLEDTRGQWVTAFHESGKSIATLPGETRALPRIESLTGRAARGTYFVLLYPSSTLACNQDGVFFIQLHPEGPARTRVVLTSCFPGSTVEQPDFEEIAASYYRRLDVSIPEDIGISEAQQVGLDSPFSTTGRLSCEEPLVHSIANWVLDRVLEPELGSAVE